MTQIRDTSYRSLEWTTAKIAVLVDSRRPLRGPLVRPVLWIVDQVYDLSLWSNKKATR